MNAKRGKWKYIKNKNKLSFLNTINRYFNTTWYYDVMMRWKGSIYMFFMHWLYADLSRFMALLIVNYNIVYMYRLSRVDRSVKIELIIILSLLFKVKKFFHFWKFDPDVFMYIIIFFIIIKIIIYVLKTN